MNRQRWFEEIVVEKGGSRGTPLKRDWWKESEEGIVAVNISRWRRKIQPFTGNHHR